MTPIPSSPIAQKPAKIGTRYIAVERVPAPHGAYIATTAASVPFFAVPSGYDKYTLLDPADAAELERLRGVEDEAATQMVNWSTDDDPVHVSVGRWRDWVEARANRIAFEKKIGGGV